MKAFFYAFLVFLFFLLQHNPHCYAQGTCGDFLITQPEICDDGNQVDGDGCSSTCLVEDGWVCAGNPNMCFVVAEEGYTCSYILSTNETQLITLPLLPSITNTTTFHFQGQYNIQRYTQQNTTQHNTTQQFDGVFTISLSSMENTTSAITLNFDMNNGLVSVLMVDQTEVISNFTLPNGVGGYSVNIVAGNGSLLWQVSSASSVVYGNFPLPVDSLAAQLFAGVDVVEVFRSAANMSLEYMYMISNSLYFDTCELNALPMCSGCFTSTAHIMTMDPPSLEPKGGNAFYPTPVAGYFPIEDSIYAGTQTVLFKGDRPGILVSALSASPPSTNYQYNSWSLNCPTGYEGGYVSAQSPFSPTVSNYKCLLRGMSGLAHPEDAGNYTEIRVASQIDPYRISGDTVSSCNANGGISIDGFGGVALQSIQYNNELVSGRSLEDTVDAGVYKFLVEPSYDNAADCSVTFFAVVNYDRIIVLYTYTNVSCNGGADGTISLTVSGGSPPYTYSWTNGATTSTITGLTAGVYVVTVTGTTGCSQRSTGIQISEPTDQLTYTIAQIVPVSPAGGGKNGGFVLDINGGTPPYLELFTNSNRTFIGESRNLTKGLYNISVSDSLGCYATPTNFVVVPEMYLINVSSNMIVAEEYPVDTDIPDFHFSFTTNDKTKVYQHTFSRNANLNVKIQITNTGLLPVYGDAPFSSSDTKSLESYFGTDNSFSNVVQNYCRNPVSDSYAVINVDEFIIPPRMTTCEPSNVCNSTILKDLSLRTANMNCSAWQSDFLQRTSISPLTGTSQSYGSCEWFQSTAWKTAIGFDSPTCTPINSFSYTTTSSTGCAPGFTTGLQRCLPFPPNPFLICSTTNTSFVCNLTTTTTEAYVKTLVPSLQKKPISDVLCDLDYVRPSSLYQINYTVSFSNGQTWKKSTSYVPTYITQHQGDTFSFDFMTVTHATNFYLEDDFLIDILLSDNPTYNVLVPDVQGTGNILFSVCTDNWSSQPCPLYTNSTFVQVDRTQYFIGDYSVSQTGKSNNQTLYTIFNNDNLPSVTIDVASDTSILRTATINTVIDINYLNANWVSQNSTMWILQVQGATSHCGGFVGLEIMVNNTPLIRYDTILECSSDTGNNFQAYFAICTDYLDADYLSNISAVLQDQTSDSAVYPPTTQPVYDLTALAPTELIINPDVLITAIIVVVVAIIMVIVVLVIGVKLPKSTVRNRLTARHMLLVACYIVVKILKSVLISLTVVYVAWKYWNEPYLEVLGSFPAWMQQYNNVTTTQVLILDVYMDTEVTRQNNLWQAQESSCDSIVIYLESNVSSVMSTVEAYHDSEINARNLTKLQFDLSMMNWNVANLNIQKVLDEGEDELKELQAKVANWYAYTIQYVKEFEALFTQYTLDVSTNVHVGLGQINTQIHGLENAWAPFVSIIEQVKAAVSVFGVTFPPYPVNLPSVDLAMPAIPPLPTYALNINLSSVLSSIKLVKPNAIPIPTLNLPSLPKIQIPTLTHVNVPSVESLSSVATHIEAPEPIHWSFSINISLTFVFIVADAFWMVFKITKSIKGVLKLMAGKNKVKDKTPKNAPMFATKVFSKMQAFQAKLAKFYLYLPLILPQLLVLCVVAALVTVTVLFILAMLDILDIDTLQRIGLIDCATFAMTVSVSLANFRIAANAEYINDISMTAEHLSFAAKVELQQQELELFNIKETVRIAVFNAQYEFLCNTLNLGSSCVPVQQVQASYTFPGKCHFTPIVPRLYTDFDQTLFEQNFKNGLAVYVVAARDVVVSTLWFALVIICIVGFMIIGGAIVWKLLARLDLLRVNYYSLIEDIPLDKMPKSKSHRKLPAPPIEDVQIDETPVGPPGTSIRVSEHRIQDENSVGDVQPGANDAPAAEGAHTEEEKHA